MFGFSVNLGSVVGLESTLFTLGLTPEQALQFDCQTGNVALNSLWTSYFSKETDAVSLSIQSRQC